MSFHCWFWCFLTALTVDLGSSSSTVDLSSFSPVVQLRPSLHYHQLIFFFFLIILSAAVLNLILIFIKIIHVNVEIKWFHLTCKKNSSLLLCSFYLLVPTLRGISNGLIKSHFKITDLKQLLLDV